MDAANCLWGLEALQGRGAGEHVGSRAEGKNCAGLWGPTECLFGRPPLTLPLQDAASPCLGLGLDRPKGKLGGIWQKADQPKVTRIDWWH